MESIVDLVIKSIISCESSINPCIQANTAYPFACHELFGFDIILDKNLKPWLLEVNISPSLHSSTVVDAEVKGPLARDVLNLAGVTIPHKSQLRTPTPANPLPQAEWSDDYWDRTDFRAKPSALHFKPEHRLKQARAVEAWVETEEVPEWVLEELTPADVRLLVEAESEWERRGEFTRLFPSPFSHSYLPFFPQPSYPNLLLHAWTTKYAHNRQKGMELLEKLCIQKKHLE